MSDPRRGLLHVLLALFVVLLIAGSPTESGYGQGLTTTEIGLILLPSGIASLLGAWLTGRIFDRVGARALIAPAGNREWPGDFADSTDRAAP